MGLIIRAPMPGFEGSWQTDELTRMTIDQIIVPAQLTHTFSELGSPACFNPSPLTPHGTTPACCQEWGILPSLSPLMTPISEHKDQS